MKFKRVSKKKLIHDNNFVLFENNWLCENKNNLIDLFQGNIWDNQNEITKVVMSNFNPRSEQNSNSR